MIPKNQLKIETMRGTGPGGQHRNKTDSACRITHLPTGISAYADERSQADSKRKALKELEARIRGAKAEKRAAAKKARRDEKIHDRTVIRTYSFVRREVKDHRTGKRAPLGEVLDKGRFDLVNP